MFGSPTSVLGVQSHQISPGGVHLHELGILPLTMLDTTPIPLVSYEGFHGHGESPKWLVCSMENPNLKKDDDWRYPYFRKPPYPLSEWNRTPEYFFCQAHIGAGSVWIARHHPQSLTLELTTKGSHQGQSFSQTIGCIIMYQHVSSCIIMYQQYRTRRWRKSQNRVVVVV